MVATKNLFMLEDRVLQQKGLYAMWTSIFLSNFVVLLTDETAGASRDFNVWANGISVLYCGAAGANNIFGNGLPSTMLLTVNIVNSTPMTEPRMAYGRKPNIPSKSGRASLRRL